MNSAVSRTEGSSIVGIGAPSETGDYSNPGASSMGYAARIVAEVVHTLNQGASERFGTLGSTHGSAAFAPGALSAGDYPGGKAERSSARMRRRSHSL